LRRTCYLALFTTAMVLAFSPQGLAASALASKPTRNQQSAPGGAASRVVTDELGRQVTIPMHVQRIVSLAPSVTEMIYALKLDDRLAGDTDYCDVPPAAKSKPHVGSLLNPNLEAIIALHPDLVLAIANSGNRKETVYALQQAGVAVYVINPRTVLEMLDSMSHIANLAGASQEGTGVVSQLKSRLDALQKRLADRPLVHVLFAVQLDPLITIGQHTFIADALRWAGAESVLLSKSDWPQLSLEEVVRLQPEYIVMASDSTDEKAKTLGSLRSRAVWKDLFAVQAGHVAVISEEIDKPAPGLIDAIEQLAHQLHPDAFAANPNREANRRGQVDNAALPEDFARCFACAH
jgi:iron complex transport system substrate-binding protein